MLLFLWHLYITCPTALRVPVSIQTFFSIFPMTQQASSFSLGLLLLQLWCALFYSTETIISCQLLRKPEPDISYFTSQPWAGRHDSVDFYVSAQDSKDLTCLVLNKHVNKNSRCMPRAMGNMDFQNKAISTQNINNSCKLQYWIWIFVLKTANNPVSVSVPGSNPPDNHTVFAFFPKI